MGRPSLLLTRVRKQGGEVVSVHVGGGCVQMMEGTLRLAGGMSTCCKGRQPGFHALRHNAKMWMPGRLAGN